MGFILLLVVLLFAQWWATESFINTDCSGNNCVRVTLSDLLNLLAGSGAPPPDDTSDTGSGSGTGYGSGSWYDKQFYSSLKGDIIKEIKNSVKQEVTANRTLLTGSADYPGDGCSCGGVGCGFCSGSMNSFADMQGKAFLTTAPGKNPNDYIRKDSIPCWGCSLK